MSIARNITKFTKQEIDTFFKTARRVKQAAGFIVLKSPRQSTRGRILIIIPKKVGSAPQRNKLRRQIRSIFYEQRLYEGDYDWAVLVKPPIKPLTFAQIKELLTPTHSIEPSIRFS